MFSRHLKKERPHMPLPSLTYNQNELEHRNFADTLGQMQALIEKGKLTKDSTNALYTGHELVRAGVFWDGLYLKKDCPGEGKTKMGRSQNRVIVRVTKEGTLVEDWAVAWRHDNRLLQLDRGFFERAKFMRDLVKST
jgi:hypothetical protein